MSKSTLDLISVIRPSIADHPDVVVPQQDRDALLESIMATAVDALRRTPVYRRPLVIGAVAAGVAGIAVVATTVIPPSGGDPAIGGVQSAAYVLDRMSQVPFDPQLVVHFRNTTTVDGGTYVEDHWFQLSSERNRSTTERADGTPCVDAAITGKIAPIGPPGERTKRPAVEYVDYTNNTWWTGQVDTGSLPAPACAAPVGALFYTLGLTTGLDLPGPADRQSITLLQAQGRVHIVRTGAIVDGQPTIELALDLITPSHDTETIWVNESTYQPVRTVTPGAHGGSIRTDCEFLPPSAANLAKLTVTVPSGFRQVAPPAGPAH